MHEPISVLALVAMFGAFHPAPAAAANTYLVNTAGDPGLPGTLSLRQAIATANSSAGNTIEFAAALAGSTITLAGGQIDITKPMMVAGPGAGALTISGNHASRIFYIHPPLTNPVAAVSISGLTLTQANGGNNNGGAIYSYEAALDLSHAVIRDSTAAYGGGMLVNGGNLTIEDSRVTGNQAGVRGGGLYISSHQVYLGRASVDGNTAGELGGGIHVGNATSLRIQASTISGNMVPQPSAYSMNTHGGGGMSIGNVTSYALIYNSTIAQNYAYTNGGGVALLDSLTANVTTFRTSTIVGNGAQIYETGIGITSAAGKSVMFASIVANNVSAGANAEDDLAGSFSVNYSLIKTPGGASVTGTGSLIGPDPQLAPLADNGGPTLTMLPATTSPVINAVPCTCSPVDQRGAPRAIAHPNEDMGAAERQYPEDLIFRNGFNPP